MDRLITEAIVAISVALAWYAWTQYIQPWLTEHHLIEATEIAVHSAEALYGRYHG